MKAERGRLFHLLHRDGPGGGPVVATQLLEGLQQEWEQGVIADGGGRMAAWCRQNGAPFYRLPMFPLSRALLGWPRLVALLRKQKPDVVILHGQWAGPLGAIACRVAGVARSVYIAHSPAFYHGNRLSRAIRGYFAESLPLRWCDRVVVLSAGNWRNYLYRGWGPEEKLMLIPNGLNRSDRPTEKSAENLRETKKWKPGDFHAVFVGRLVDQKKPEWMLEAWRRFLARAPEFKGRAFLHFVGDGPDGASLRELARTPPLEDSVEFAGEQDQPLNWIAAADLVVMTSLYEGHALVPLEAMLCGRPILAMRADGVEESVEDGQTGWLVPLADFDGFSARLAELARDPELRKRFGEQAGRSAAKWDWQISLHHYRSLLKNLGPWR